MSNTTISPNMSLPVPTVGVDPGPDYATNVNSSLNIIDSHNHSAGQGVQINPNGLNINSDLPFNNNNATTVRSINFFPQNSTLALATDIGCIYVSGVDLYFNDENGNTIRITQSGSVAGSTGTITGLPSGTAGASFAAGTFTFLAATSTPAAMNFGPITMGQSLAGTKTVTIQTNAAQAGNYNLTWPAALPGSTNYVTLDASGNVSYNANGVTGTGANVLGISPTITTPSISGPTISAPTFSGTISGTITSATYTPTVTWSGVNPTVNTNFAQYLRINNTIFASGKITITNPSSSTVARFASVTIPVATANLSNASSGSLTAYSVSSGGSTSVTGTFILVNSGTTTMNIQSGDTATGAGTSNGTATYEYQFSYIVS